MQNKHLKERNQVVNNIYSLSQMREMELAEVEKALGVSRGYIKHLQRTDSGLTLDFLLNVAELFEVDVNLLITHNYDTDLRKHKAEVAIEFLESQRQAIEQELSQAQEAYNNIFNNA